MAASASTAVLNQTAFYRSKSWAQWQTLIPILFLALVLRVVYFTDAAYHGDMDHFAVWVDLIRTKGPFDFYNPTLRVGTWDRTYPQLSTLAFDAIAVIHRPIWTFGNTLADPVFTSLDKVLPVLCELALIVVVYAWLREKPVLRWLIPGLIAIYPGLIATSAWWGQYESTFTLFLVLALLALNQDRPVWAWASFAVACLFKQPAAVLAPLLLVLSYRRYGWRPTLQGIGVFVGICAVILLPFIIGSGFEGALSPYLKAADIFPYMMNNAFNFWYVLAFLNHGGAPIVFDRHYADAQSIIGAFTYKDAGVIMYVSYILIISVLMWRHSEKRYEFVWATALTLGFFILPTQVHERYIYPAAVLALLAVAQERRMWWVAIPMIWTFSYNVLGIAIPYKWPTISSDTDVLSLPTALLNVAMFVWLTYFLLRQKTVEDGNDREYSTSAA